MSKYPILSHYLHIGIAFNLDTHEVLWKDLKIPPPKTKKDLKRWLEDIKDLPLVKEHLLIVLKKLYTDEKAEVLAGSILAGRMLAPPDKRTGI
jgi:hypothetical protein